MLEDEAGFLGGFTFGVEFGLIYVRDAEGEGLGGRCQTGTSRKNGSSSP